MTPIEKLLLFQTLYLLVQDRNRETNRRHPGYVLMADELARYIGELRRAGACFRSEEQEQQRRQQAIAEMRGSIPADSDIFPEK